MNPLDPLLWERTGWEKLKAADSTHALHGVKHPTSDITEILRVGRGGLRWQRPWLPPAHGWMPFIGAFQAVLHLGIYSLRPAWPCQEYHPLVGVGTAFAAPEYTSVPLQNMGVVYNLSTMDKFTTPRNCPGDTWHPWPVPPL